MANFVLYPTGELVDESWANRPFTRWFLSCELEHMALWSKSNWTVVTEYFTA